MSDYPTPNLETKQMASIFSTGFKQGAFSGLAAALLSSILFVIIGLVYTFDWDIRSIPVTLFVIGIVKAVLLSSIVAVPVCGFAGLVIGWISKNIKVAKIGGIVKALFLSPLITALLFPRF